MQSRTFKVGDLRRALQESTQEFKPKFGDDYSKGKEKELNREAYKEISKETGDYNKDMGEESKPVMYGGNTDTVNKGMSDLQYDGEISDTFKKRAIANMEGFTSELDKKEHENEELGNATRNDEISQM